MQQQIGSNSSESAPGICSPSDAEMIDVDYAINASKNQDHSKRLDAGASPFIPSNFIDVEDDSQFPKTMDDESLEALQEKIEKTFEDDEKLFQEKAILKELRKYKEQSKEKNGLLWVPIMTLLSCEKIKNQCPENEIGLERIILCLGNSPNFILNAGQTHFARKRPIFLKDKKNEEMIYRTVKATNLPADSTKSSLFEKFSKFGMIEKFTLHEKKSDEKQTNFQRFVTCTYSHKNMAHKACIELTDTTNWRSGLRVVMVQGKAPHVKKDWSKNSNGSSGKMENEKREETESFSNLCKNAEESNKGRLYVGKVFSISKQFFTAEGTELLPCEGVIKRDDTKQTKLSFQFSDVIGSPVNEGDAVQYRAFRNELNHWVAVQVKKLSKEETICLNNNSAFEAAQMASGTNLNPQSSMGNTTSPKRPHTIRPHLGESCSPKLDFSNKGEKSKEKVKTIFRMANGPVEGAGFPVGRGKPIKKEI
mmetsp:Transcript_1351/g.1791  ORF Transcript_1351/g.1791 Transcript_1351/m.1791 type:complete len:478 (-) Transcript_1351:32-1465(-)|eukprot:CAMPEP_0171476542 /NCGR_PEP_ID=MMETSP0946-20130122/3649_1 /TAXON_ID=109269 /ORGANISM="Vaucheria litorea, Strain CCMP2940" /LENGTH=477 /DNA_ID=CAMNT_0012006817 /DNA_START=48 /DNA_END=1481 /DNA_ORIENTATION=-